MHTVLCWVLLFCVIDISVSEIGPSGAGAPFLVPVQGETDLRVVNIASAGSVLPSPAPRPYTLVGIMDGLGARVNPLNDSQVIVYVNHGTGRPLFLRKFSAVAEISAGFGGARAHGSRGAFVSKVVLDRLTLEVIAASDLVESPQDNRVCEDSVLLRTDHFYIHQRCAEGENEFCSFSFDRFCSADLPEATALYNSASGKGTTNRIFMNGEESDDGRAMAWILDGPESGTVHWLRALGAMRFENVVASPLEQDTTVACVTDDAAPLGALGIYVGQKRDSGTDLERAGLVDGVLYAMSVQSLEGLEVTANTQLPANARFSLKRLNDDEGRLPRSAADTRLLALQREGTLFRRPEDCAWHPQRPNELLLVSSDTVKDYGGRTRLWSFVFDDLSNPTAGGTASWVLDGTEPVEMMDNVGVTHDGLVLVTEDTGSYGHNTRVLAVGPRDTGNVTAVRPLLEHDPEAIAAGLFTVDAEATGVIDASALFGAGWCLLADQLHQTTPEFAAEVLEKGQLVAFQVDTSMAGATAQPLIFGMQIERTTYFGVRVTATVLNIDAYGGHENWEISVVYDAEGSNAPTTRTAVETNSAQGATDKFSTFGHLLIKDEHEFVEAAHSRDAMITIRISDGAGNTVQHAKSYFLAASGAPDNNPLQSTSSSFTSETVLLDIVVGILFLVVLVVCLCVVMVCLAKKK